MGTIALLPWVVLSQPIRIGRFQLRPFHTDTGDEDVARVLRGHRILPDLLLDAATVIEADDAKLEDNWSNQQVESTFDFVEALAFASIAHRQFFDPFGEYSNRDSFALTVQRFEEGKGGSLLEHRRRDGSKWVYTPERLIRVQMPPHVARLWSPVINVPLVMAVANEMAASGSFDRSIREFNDANTDRPGVREAQELLSMVSAFEQLLGVGNGDTKKTRMNFLVATSVIPAVVVTPAKPTAATRLHNGSYASIRDLWMADICTFRGSVAHGHGVKAYPAIWSASEHLLIAAFIFPITVKLRLFPAYSPSAEETSIASVFDRLLASQHVLRNHGEPGADDYEWHRVLSSR